MALIGNLFLLLVIFAGCIVGPGLLVVRRAKWQPLEKLCGSIAVSCLLVYLASFGLFMAGLPKWNFTISVVAWIATLVAWNDLFELFADRKVRLAIATWAGVVAWCFLAVLMVRNIGGGDWAGDWVEHYQRAEFFLGKYPNDFRFIDIYQLPARLPLMNVLCAFFMAQVGRGFELYQALHVLLGTLVVLPCCLWALRGQVDAGGETDARYSAALATGKRVAGPAMVCLVLGGLIAFNPSFVQNIVFVWTKLFAAFFAALGIYLYVQAWRGGRQSQLIAAFSALAIGILVHHSIGIYALALAVHYLGYLFWRRENRWRELAFVGMTSCAIVGTWFTWSFATFGVRDTIFANHVFKDYTKSTAGGDDYDVVVSNWLYSFVPYPLHSGFAPKEFEKLVDWERTRNQAFFIYQTNLLPMMGSIGGLLVVALLVAELWKKQRTISVAESYFWLGFLTIVPLLGIGVVFSLAPFGLAHTSLQPLTILGLAFLASRYHLLPRWLAAVLLLGIAIDYAAGVWLNLNMDSIVFKSFMRNRKLAVENPLNLSISAVLNWVSKEKFHYRFLGDHLVGFSTAIQVLMAGSCAMWLGVHAILLTRGRRVDKLAQVQSESEAHVDRFEDATPAILKFPTQRQQAANAHSKRRARTSKSNRRAA